METARSVGRRAGRDSGERMRRGVGLRMAPVGLGRNDIPSCCRAPQEPPGTSPVEEPVTPARCLSGPRASTEPQRGQAAVLEAALSGRRNSGFFFPL